MNRSSAIEEEFRHRAIVRGSLILFHAPDAMKVVKRCRELRVPILGIDSFLVFDEMIQPSMEHSIDFTDELVTTKDSWGAAEAFIESKKGTDFVFEVVMEQS